MMLSPCGVNCAECNFYQDTCSGCREIEGKVFWAGYVGASACPMYHCSVNEKKLNHCGECAELPCHFYYDTQDPATTKEEHEAGIKLRVDSLMSMLNQKPNA